MTEHEQPTVVRRPVLPRAGAPTSAEASPPGKTVTVTYSELRIP
ncbi:hypothetical protein [Streptomyces sp. NBC_00038]|nr:hypothetical protein [Streptomyces sp. NBC_00038]